MTAPPAPQQRPWPILDLTRYDRTPMLSDAEQASLRRLRKRRPGGGSVRAITNRLDGAQRLVRPIEDALALVEANPLFKDIALLTLLRLCLQEGEAFWGWDLSTWSRLLDPRNIHTASRPCVLAAAYILDCLPDPTLVTSRVEWTTLARKVLGRANLDDAATRVEAVLSTWGYRSQTLTAVRVVTAIALLLCKSGRLEDISSAQLQAIWDCEQYARRRGHLVLLSRALHDLKIIDHALSGGPARPPTESFRTARSAGVPEAWFSVVDRWEATSTLAPSTRAGIRNALLRIGRWLSEVHPDITTPDQWDRALAANAIATIDRWRVGDYTSTPPTRHVGKPIAPAFKSALIQALRVFFADLQEWGWISRRLNPLRTFAVPRSIRALIGPAPRVIADDVWAKLLWAGLNLEPGDFPRHGPEAYPEGERESAGHPFYPVPLLRALALVWLFAGLRSDEILRLRVGCFRWQSDDGAVPGTDDPLPGDAVCLLDVPAHKTGADFTKPVDPVVGRGLEAWQAARPSQPPLLDERTGEVVDFLFSFRGRPVAKNYLNKGLIPTLCRKAGVPRSDARGAITSHRARSTIATQLYNAKEPMSLFELQAWLGHRSPSSTQHYARITPNTLTKAYRDAGYFARNVRAIEVLVDRDAVQSGAAASGEPWQYFDLGHGFCTYSFFEQCPHRMACARCDFYVPKQSTKAQLLEAKDNLQRMVATIPLTDDERAAVDDGADSVGRLITRLSDVPTPAGPTPREMTLIPLRTLPPR